MWIWPLDRAMEAIATHRALEKMADGTCTWGLAWMTDKCRRKMNGREEYIITEIIQKGRKKGGGPEGSGGPRGRWRPKERKEAPVWPIGVEDSRPWVRGPFSLGCWPPDSVCFLPPKRVVASSEPNFWTHSLQIHCNGLGPKTVILQ